VKDPRVYAAHILECLQRIQRYCEGGKHAFFSSALIQDAVERNFEIIGEAAKRIPEDYRSQHSAVPGRGLAGLRDILIRQYESVDLEKVWEVVEQQVSQISETLASILPPLTNSKLRLPTKHHLMTDDDLQDLNIFTLSITPIHHTLSNRLRW